MMNVLAVIALLGLLGCGEGDSPPPAASVSPPESTEVGTGAAATAAYSNPAPYGPAVGPAATDTTVRNTQPSRYSNPVESTSNPATASQTQSGGSRYPSIDSREVIATITTSEGPISIRLLPNKAPLTVDNFLRNYVDTSFYEKTVVHYADNNLVAAGGFDASLEAKLSSPPIRNEANNGLKNVRGTVAMGRAFDQIDSATSQFFFNVSDNAEFDHIGKTAEDYGYCVFAEVISGMDVVDKIANAPTQSSQGLENVPAKPVVILSVRVKQD